MKTSSQIPPTPFQAATLSQDKAEARAHARAMRRLAHADYGRVAAEKLALYAGLIDVGVETVVAGYFPMADEIDPRPLLEDLMGRGCTLALPVVTQRGQPLEFRAWGVGDPLEDGPHGTVHPLSRAARVRPAIMLVPLLAFDLQGFRLGYGGGYYDRTLAQLRDQGQVIAIGLAFGVQRVVAVPHDHLDQRLDLILTENGPITPEKA